MMNLRILLLVILMTGCHKKDPAENNNPVNGTYTKSIAVNGKVREYLIHIPNCIRWNSISTYYVKLSWLEYVR